MKHFRLHLQRVFNLIHMLKPDRLHTAKFRIFDPLKAILCIFKDGIFRQRETPQGSVRLERVRRTLGPRTPAI